MDHAMDDASSKETISCNYELLQTTQAVRKNSTCKRFGFKKILFILAILQLLCIWYLYKVNYWNSSSISKELGVDSDDIDPFKTKRGSDFVFHLPLTQPTDMSKYYEEIDESISCMTAGLSNEDSENRKCLCLDGWSGSDCGIPFTIWDSGFLRNGTAKGIKVLRRQQPRRIIHSIWLNGSAKLLQDMIKMYYDIVDVFLIGHYPGLKVSNKYNLNFAAQKIIYVPLPSPEISEINLAVAQYKLWRYAKTILSDVRPDDIIVMSDVFNFPSKEVLVFLKLYDGFSEPVFFYLSTQEKSQNNASEITNSSSTFLSANIAVCHIEFLRYLCNYDARLVWFHYLLKDKTEIMRYEKSMKNTKFHPWNVGSTSTAAGSFISEKTTRNPRSNFRNLAPTNTTSS